VRETRAFAEHEAATHVNTSAAAHQGLSTRQVFLLTSFKEKALSAASQAGMVNNLNDGLAWGIFPLLFASYGLAVSRIGILAALYPAVWGVGQLYHQGLSDRVGRKWLIAAGMWTQAVAIGLIAAVRGFWPWTAGAPLLGAGTAMVYPTLLATIGDVAHPRWRASSVGVYRLWRDGEAVGALLAGVVADLLGPRRRPQSRRHAQRPPSAAALRGVPGHHRDRRHASPVAPRPARPGVGRSEGGAKSRRPIRAPHLCGGRRRGSRSAGRMDYWAYQSSPRPWPCRRLSAASPGSPDRHCQQTRSTSRSSSTRSSSTLTPSASIALVSGGSQFAVTGLPRSRGPPRAAAER
jgi:hypothetical protein